ncbi:MAG: UTP--glucose-1-phosphate uridylyltransferase GalU [Chloroflexota bacterium]
MKVRKVVITAAGWGTRFLPITRSLPKEMLPLINKPLIQFSVEEAISSGIDQIIVITAMGKRAIEDYFDRSHELENFLESKGQFEQLSEMRRLSNLVNICYIRQKEQLGLGHAVLMAKDVVGNEPFAVLLPDDIIDSQVPPLKQMMDVYEQYQTSVVAVERVRYEDTVKYGIISPKTVPFSTSRTNIYQVAGLVEKPDSRDAPSDLGIVGRYILTPDIFAALEATPPGKGHEIQLTDALQLLCTKNRVYACEFEGVRYDTGNPLGWLKATIAFALKHPEIKNELRDYLYKILPERQPLK